MAQRDPDKNAAERKCSANQATSRARHGAIGALPYRQDAIMLEARAHEKTQLDVLTSKIQVLSESHVGTGGLPLCPSQPQLLAAHITLQIGGNCNHWWLELSFSVRQTHTLSVCDTQQQPTYKLDSSCNAFFAKTDQWPWPLRCRMQNEVLWCNFVTSHHLV